MHPVSLVWLLIIELRFGVKETGPSLRALQSQAWIHRESQVQAHACARPGPAQAQASTSTHKLCGKGLGHLELGEH